MKKTQLLIVLALLPLMAHSQQYRQRIPDNVSTIELSGNTSADISFGDETDLITFDNNPHATIKDNRLIINRNDYVKIVLAEGASITLIVGSNAYVGFHAPYRPLGKLGIDASDNANISFKGSETDTLHVGLLEVSQRGNAYINDKKINIHSDKSSWNYSTVKGLDNADGGATASAAKRHSGNKRYRREANITLDWGLHNWGSEPTSGFGGVQGDAAINTRPGNWQLALSFPFISTSHFGAYLGLGLEWDRFRFQGNDIYIGATSFTDNATAGYTTSLRTRAVVLPVSLRFDLGHSRDWSLLLSALPGLYWTGSHTGLQRELETPTGKRNERDLSVNHHISPYKFDVRAMLLYDGIGIYTQISLTPLLKEGFDKLYPVRFGLAINIGD